MSDLERSGQCLCGAVSFTVSGPMRGVISCHCGQCRRTHGHFAAYTAAPREAISFLAAEGLQWFASSDKARRGFCSVCGSSLFWDLLGDSQLRIAAGSIDLPTGLATVKHIYVDDAGDYYDIADGLPQERQSMLPASE